MNKQQRKEYICAGALMTVGIPLLAIMTKLVYEVVVQGKSVEIVKQYEPVCYCLMGLLVFVGIVVFYMLGDEGGNKNEKAKWIMLTTGAIGVALIPTAIFVPMFVSIFSPIDMSLFQLLIGMFALLFGMIFVAVGLFLSPYFIKKEGKDDA